MLSRETEGVQSSFERLSSGLRINKASDDPAGLSISVSLKSDSRIYTQGVRNLNDGLSALSIAESSVDQLTQVVTRIRELAEQAASARSRLHSEKRLIVKRRRCRRNIFGLSSPRISTA